ASYQQIKDELNPQETPRDMFGWILGDIMAADAEEAARLARKTEPSAEPSKQAKDLVETSSQ
ncbi:MAG TPA: hypothetical protein PKN86_10835, partial [Candidatus Obscuribacter sp.]|nr:hypothetical protein [Candidatus Obscuribacter sp.]